jgi:hypothetical protein
MTKPSTVETLTTIICEMAEDLATLHDQLDGRTPSMARMRERRAALDGDAGHR